MNVSDPLQHTKLLSAPACQQAWTLQIDSCPMSASSFVYKMHSGLAHIELCLQPGILQVNALVSQIGGRHVQARWILFGTMGGCACALTGSFAVSQPLPGAPTVAVYILVYVHAAIDCIGSSITSLKTAHLARAGSCAALPVNRWSFGGALGWCAGLLVESCCLFLNLFFLCPAGSRAQTACRCIFSRILVTGTTACGIALPRTETNAPAMQWMQYDSTGPHSAVAIMLGTFLLRMVPQRSPGTADANGIAVASCRKRCEN